MKLCRSLPGLLAALACAGLFSMGTAQAATRSAEEAADACRSLQGNRFESLEGAPTYVLRATWRPATTEQGAACALEGYVNPSVVFGLLMPADNWNGKYMVRGCGGSCGDVFLEAACRWHVRDGYACLHSDMGHRSSMVDNNWVAGNLQGLVDFGYRATHVSSVAGKAIVEAYYAARPRRSYFFACSTGGRQGLIEAQRFPGDFDGIVAIAPTGTKPFDDLRPEREVNPDAVNTGADGRPILPGRKALLVHRAVVQRCDMNDGLRDGLIGNPQQCKFDPAELQCKGTDARQCLTAAQVNVVRRYYDEIGAQRGSEFNWIGAWLRPAVKPGEASKPLPWLGRGRGDPALVDSLNSANHPDLRPFKRRLGKLILVQGWDDQSVLPLPTIDYYETMSRTMGGPDTTRDFARLFMIPGMDHCAGGKGATAIDYTAALDDWVEGGRAPEALIGVHPLPGSPLDYFATNLARVDAKWFEFTRAHPAWTAGARTVPPQTPQQVSPQASPQAPPSAPHNGLPRPADAATPLPQALAASLRDAEAYARASLFPPPQMAGYVGRAVWRLLFERGSEADEALAALRSLARESLSPVAREVAERMQTELLAD